MRSDAPGVGGSGLGGTPDEDAIGILKPHAALVEYAFDPTVEMVPGGELPAPKPTERTGWDVVAGILDWMMSVNPITGQTYRMAKMATAGCRPPPPRKLRDRRD